MTLFSNTHHCLLHVNFLTTGQAEVCYFSHKVIAYENIPGCQIPVDKLLRERRITGEPVLSDISPVDRLNSKFKRATDCHVRPQLISMNQ